MDTPDAAALIVLAQDSFQGIDGFLPFSHGRASFMLDVVFLAMFVVVPVLALSVWLVKKRRNYRLHKLLQVTLASVLLAAVMLFEIDMRVNGWDVGQSGRDRKWYISGSRARKGPFGSRKAAEAAARRAPPVRARSHHGARALALGDERNHPRQSRAGQAHALRAARGPDRRAHRLSGFSLAGCGPPPVVFGRRAIMQTATRFAHALAT